MFAGTHPPSRALPTAFVMAALLAGCVAPQAPGATDATEVLAALPLAYECPAGETITLSNGLCVATFGDPRETFEEPYLAVHPQQPEVMVLGMNAWHAQPQPVLLDGLPSLELGRVALFVTEDAGATWRRVTSPPILYGSEQVGKTSYSGDPVLEFDARGVLHYLQTSVAFDGLDSGNFPYIDIQYARSEDLGSTWSQNVLLADDGDNDRPWLWIGDDDQVYVVWRNNIADLLPPELARSTDGGATWETFSAPPECTHGDRAIVHGDGVLVPCALHQEGAVTAIQINRFDPATERFEPVGRLPTPEGWSPGEALVQWDRSRDGAVLAVATRQQNADGFVTFSRDGGLTWTQPLGLLDLCRCDPDTGSLHTFGARFDAWGGFHIMLTDAFVQTPDAWDESNTRYAAGDRAVFHLVVDAHGAVVHQEKLFTSAREDPRVPPSAAAPIGRDDYFIPAFWGDAGAIVWTRDKGVDLARVVPDASGEDPPV